MQSSRNGFGARSGCDAEFRDACSCVLSCSENFGSRSGVFTLDKVRSEVVESV
jgi:hypothetical protein